MSKNASATDFKVELWPIDKPKPYEQNARVIPQAAIEKVAASIQQYGWQQPLVVDKKGVLIVGHTRLLAAKHLGLTDVPVKIATNLSPEKVRAYRIMDNRSNEETTWDNDILGKELAAIGEGDIDLTAITGFDESELKDLLPELAEEHPPTRAVKKEQTAIQAKVSSKILHTCPECGHSWHAGDTPPPVQKTKRKNPFGKVEE